MRNHGDSDHSDSMTYKEMAEDVIRYADKQKLERFTLLGHSMGAKTAMTISGLYPNRLDGIIVVDAPPEKAIRDRSHVSKTVQLVFGSPDHAECSWKD